MTDVATIIRDLSIFKQYDSTSFLPGKSRTADKFVVRFPDGMREVIAYLARINHRSMNNEIISGVDLLIRLHQLGLSQYVQELAKGKIKPEFLSDIAASVGKITSEPPVTENVQFRAGDPVMHDGTAWVIIKLTARTGNIYAKIEREDPADGSKTDTTEVRYSALKPFQA